MPDTGAPYYLPTPADTDPLGNVAASIRSLAAKVHTELDDLEDGVVGGTVTVSIPSGTNPQVGSIYVTFPRAFKSVPAVSVTGQGPNPQNTNVSFDLVTLSGFRLYVARMSGGFASAGASWLATGDPS